MRNIRVKTYNIKCKDIKDLKFKIEKEKILYSKHVDKRVDFIQDVDKTKKRVDLIEILDKNLEEVDLVKHENVNEEEVLIPVNQPSADPIKAEMSESFIEIDKHVSNILGMNTDGREKTNNNTKNSNDIENTNYDSDVDFDMGNSDHADTSSDDDASLSIALKKRGKAKRKTTRKTKAEPKVKKTKTENEKEVQLKNTQPKKHFLNPQFWKKITLSEEEAVREFKQREFNNDYYLRAKYKCQNCYKGFSKNEMLVRHLKHWHDEVRFID